MISISNNEMGSLHTALHQFQGDTMGTRYRVCLVAEQNIDLPNIQSEIQSAVDTVDNQMSTWKADSALSRFNQSSSREWQDVPKPLAYVVSEAVKLSAVTDGAFDVTLGAAVNLWGFGPEGTCRHLPEVEKIERCVNDSGFEKLETRLDSPALRKKSNFYIDLSGIAKGFGIDQMARVLDKRGFSNYLLEIDGEICVRGCKIPPYAAWTIAIENPEPNVLQAYDLLQPRDCSIATSGNYRNFAMLDGKHYAHTLDTKSGQPVNNEVRSVTVIHRSCMMADAWATALLALGVEKGFEIAKNRHIPALFLIRDECITDECEVQDIMTPEFAAIFDE